MDDIEDKSWRRGIWEKYEVWSRSWMALIERKELRGRERP